MYKRQDWDSTNEGDEFIPIKISPSIKRTLEEQANNKRSQPLSLIVPRSSCEQEIEYASYPSPSLPTPLSSDLLASLSNGGYSVGKKSLTPSLDSTGTTVATGSGICPSTPIEDDEGYWSVPILLDPEVADVLKHMSHKPVVDDLDDITHPNKVMAARGLGTQLDSSKRTDITRRESTEPTSAITVPSPDVFFASLDADAQQVWRFSLRHVSPTTAVAEEFYDVPWRRKQDDPVELEGSAPIALPLGTTNVVPSDEDLYYEPPSVEYDENYQPKLLNDGQANLDRTKTWIQMQETWLQKRVLSLVVVNELTSEGTVSYTHLTLPTKRIV